MVDAAWAQAALGDLKARAFAQDQVFSWHAHIFHLHFEVAMWRIVIAKHVQRTNQGHAFCIQRHQDLALLGIGFGARIGLAHHDGDFAAWVAYARAPPLGAIDDIFIAIAHN